MEEVLAFIFITAMWIGAYTYVGNLERKEQFGLRLTLSVASFYLLTFLCMNVLSREMVFLRLLWRVIGMPVLWVFIYGCWKLSFSLSLYYAMWAFMSWQLLCELWVGANAFLQSRQLSTPVQDIISCVVLFGIGHLLICFTLARWMPEDGKEKLGPRQLILAVVTFSAFEVLGYTPGKDNITPGKGEWLVIYLTQILLGVLLYLQSELFKKSAMRQELDTINLLWRQQKEHYELSKENIALIVFLKQTV